MATKFQTLQQAVQDQTREWVEVLPPFKLMSDGDGIKLVLPEDEAYLSYHGLGYALYRLGADVAQSNNAKDMWAAEDVIGLQALLRKLYADAVANGRFGDNEPFIVAVINGKVMAFLSTYNPVDHADLVEEIAKANLKSKVWGWRLNDHRLAVHMAGRMDRSGKVTFGITMQNGTSGTVSFNFRSFFAVGDIVIDFPLHARTRHIGEAVERSVENLVEVLEEAQLVEFEAVMDEMTSADVYSIATDIFTNVTPKTEELLETIRKAKAKGLSALDLLPNLEVFAQTRGYKGITTKLINAVVDWVVERL